MTPPTLDTDPPNAADCAKRNMALLPPFGLIIPHPLPEPSSTSTTPTSAGSESPCDAYDASRTNRALARQWTGAPIRAIIPLPRRKLVLNGAQSVVTHLGVPVSNTAVGPPCLMRSAHFRDDADTDSGAEIEEEDEDEDDEGSDEGCDAPSGSRCCSYESITAAEGLAAWSFEVRPPFSRRFFPRAD